MKIMLLGAPGSGKGTQGEKLSQAMGIPRLSTGDMLRAEVQAQTPIGLEIAALMPTGQLIGDEIVIGLIKQRVNQADCANGYILDGFPRTLHQAQTAVEAGILIDTLLELTVDDEAIITRMAGRRLHPASGRTYHVALNPPRVADIDDLSGEPLITRPDDEASVVRERLEIYRAQTLPLLNYFQSLAIGLRPRIMTVNGEGEVDAVAATVRQVLGSQAAI
jgi:adenylate kinase